MAQEKYFGNALGIDAPSDEPRLLVPHNTLPLKYGKPNYLYVGVAGDLKMRFKDDKVITAIVGQGYHKFRPEQIFRTGTTADNIIGLYDGLPVEVPPPPAQWFDFQLNAADVGNGKGGFLNKEYTEAPENFGSISNEPCSAGQLMIFMDMGRGDGGYYIIFKGDLIDELNKRGMTIDGVAVDSYNPPAYDGSGFYTIVSFDSDQSARLAPDTTYNISFPLL